MPRDNSWSGFAQSIANLLALANLRDQAIIDVLTVHRREHGDAGKREPKALSFFVHTIATARKWATEQQERDRKRAEREAKQKEVEEQEAKECALIAEVSASDLDAQKRLADCSNWMCTAWCSSATTWNRVIASSLRMAGARASHRWPP